MRHRTEGGRSSNFIGDEADGLCLSRSDKTSYAKLGDGQTVVFIVVIRNRKLYRGAEWHVYLRGVVATVRNDRGVFHNRSCR